VKKNNRLLARILLGTCVFTFFNLADIIVPITKVQASTVGTKAIIRSEADTFVSSAATTVPGHNGTNTGTGSSLRVSDTESAYMRFNFNVTSLNDIQSVSTAMLRMSHSNTNVVAGKVKHNVYMCTDDSWNVATMNYETRVTNEVYLGSYEVAITKNTWYTYIDIAQLVNQALANSDDRIVTLRIALADDSPNKTAIWYQSDENYFRPYLDVTPATLRVPPTPPPPPMPAVPLEPVYYARYEAESVNAVVAPGTIDQTHMYFSGEGFANTANVRGAYVEFTFDMPEAGFKYLGFVYAHAAGTDRAAQLSVNGVNSVILPFADTTAWNYWQYQLYSANLKAGENKVRITATSLEGLVNLDCLDIIGGPKPAQLPPPPTSTPAPLEYLPLGPAPSPSPVGTAIKLGNTEILTVNETTNSKNLEMNRISVHQTAVIKSLSLYVESGSGNMRMALYNDDSGKPGQKIATTEDFAVTTGWNTKDLNYQLQLLPGEDYWIGYQTDSDNLAVKTEAAGGNNYSYQIGYSTGMPKGLEGRPKTETLERCSMYANLVAVNQIPVAPGIGGFGIYTQGGRNGRVIKVTNLNDRGPGSLREACQAEGPRIVVFEVAGYIELTGSIQITNPYITIAGQTAPTPGITLKNAGIAIKSSDVFIQHIRARIGDGLLGDTYEDRDVFQMVGDDKLHDIVLDHVSGSWSIDEILSTWPAYGADDVLARRKNIRNITISNSLWGPPLASMLHPKGGHPFGILVGDSTSNMALIGNFQGSTWQRAPLIKGGSTAYVANNIWYNNHQPAATLYADVSNNTIPRPVLVSYIGNNWVKGPLTLDEIIINIHSYPGEDKNRFEWYPGTKVYFNDNKYYGTKLWIDPGYAARWGDAYVAPEVDTPPVVAKNYTPVSPQESEKRVLASAGARPNERDSVDLKQISDYNARIGQFPATMAEIGGFPVVVPTARAFIVPENANGDDDNDGYTNIEEVLQQMAAALEYSIADVEITGTNNITVPLDGTTTKAYTAEVKDQQWNTVPDKSISWSVYSLNNGTTSSAIGVNISQNGELLVRDTATAGTYVINASTDSANGDKIGKMEITLQKPPLPVAIENLTTVDHFTLGSDAKVRIRATNNTVQDQSVGLIAGLYTDDNKMVTFGVAQQKIVSNGEVELEVMLQIPSSGNYKVKYFVWDSLEGMRPIKGAIPGVIPVQ
jgi:hypothetical protein